MSKNKNKNMLGLSDRMKMYERPTKYYLMRRTPVIIRIDGKAFHTFTKNFPKPFCSVLSRAMQDTMKYLCDNIQGCIFGYTQSDEISLVLIDYQRYETDAWFDNNLQKIVSVSSSMATMAFNKFFRMHLIDDVDEMYKRLDSGEPVDNITESIRVLFDSIDKGALFDSRAFNISEDEIANYIYYRYNDAFRNGVSTYARNTLTHMSNKTINKLSTTEKISAITNKFYSITKIYDTYGHNFFGTYYSNGIMTTINRIHTSQHFHKIIREVLDTVMQKNNEKDV